MTYVSAKEPTLCLNMIVKDESPVIKRCLASLKPYIDYWVIVDTGSRDGTQEVIREFMKDVPGELHERPWVDFAHNRNEAMQFAKGKADYLIFIDADEEIKVYDPSFKNKLKQDSYFVHGYGLQTNGNTLKFVRTLVINNHLNWSWKGVIHECLVWPQNATYDTLTGFEFIATAQDGHRAMDPKKYIKDAELLEKAIVNEPENERYVFYLACTYDVIKEYALALKNFEKRSTMKWGDEQEVYYSLYSAGKMKENLKMNPGSIGESFSDAYHFRPTRAEPLFHLARLYMEHKNYTIGYALSKLGVSIPLSQDRMLVEPWIYEYGLPYLYATAAFELKKYDEAAAAYEKVVDHPDLPKEYQEIAKMNLISIKLKKFKN